VIVALVFSIRSGSRVGQIEFVHTDGPAGRHGEARVTAVDPASLIELTLHFEQPHILRGRQADGMLYDRLVPTGTEAHFRFRLEALPLIGYRAELGSS
jgi:hypothetical protein